MVTRERGGLDGEDELFLGVEFADGCGSEGGTESGFVDGRFFSGQPEFAIGEIQAVKIHVGYLR